MNWRVIGTLVAKDFKLFFRNQFFAFVTVLGLVAWIAIYYVLPRSVDETLEIGWVVPSMPGGEAVPLLGDELAAEGLLLKEMDSEQALREAILAGDLAVGLVLADDFLPSLALGRKGQVTLLFSSDFPDGLHDTYVTLFQEFAFAAAGEPLPVEITEEILGPDMAGQQIPLRNRMRPLFAIFAIMVETMGLASLMSTELEAGTHRALQVAGVTVRDLFGSKGTTAMAMTLGQAVLLMAAMGGLRQHPVLILVTLVLGSLLVTGIGFLIASVARDMMSVMAWGVLSVVIMAVPAVSVTFPGTVSNWARAIPTYYLVDTVHRTSSLGGGWGDAWLNLGALLAFSIAFLALGMVVLQRRMR